MIFVSCFVLALAVHASAVRRWTDCGPSAASPNIQAALRQTPYSTLAQLGPYSPYIPVTGEICNALPDGYVVDQVQIIARHGARNPTASALTKILATIAGIKNGTRAQTATGEFAFVRNFKYSNIAADQLTDFGRKEVWQLGQWMRNRYGHLGRAFVRASSDGRVVESSQFFLQGFSGAGFDLKANRSQPDVVIYEGGNVTNPFNNTLSMESCPSYENASSVGSKATANWLSVWSPPIASRINEALGANISGSDVTNLLSLCSFDSLKGSEWSQSPWCGVFSTEEYNGNEYYYDLSKFYDHSWGNPYSRAQGIGLVNEIIGRLTSKTPMLGSGINSTLDASSATFPLNYSVYADFSHDNNIATLLPALGLEWETDLPTKANTTAIPPHKFVVSKLVPFAGRYIFERVKGEGKTWVRLTVNERVIPLTYAGCGQSGWKTGLCELSAFVAGNSAARQTPSLFDQICYGAEVKRTVAIAPYSDSVDNCSDCAIPAKI